MTAPPIRHRPAIRCSLTLRRSGAPAAAPAKPAPAAKQPGVNYTIRWGDTLWDLAYAYYRNPWLYPRIAKANGHFVATARPIQTLART